MGDQRLRDLERLIAAGESAAKPALLRQKLRLGLLTLEDVRLAAFLGYENAYQVLEEPRLRPGVRFRRCVAAGCARHGRMVGNLGASRSMLGDWLEGIATFGQEPAVRAALVIAKTVFIRRADLSQTLTRGDRAIIEIHDGVRDWLIAGPARPLIASRLGRNDLRVWAELGAATLVPVRLILSERSREGWGAIWPEGGVEAVQLLGEGGWKTAHAAIQREMIPRALGVVAPTQRLPVPVVNQSSEGESG